MRREAEPHHAGRVERRLLTPARRARDRERQAALSKRAVRVEQRREVLARLERRDRERVRPAEIDPRAAGRKTVVDARIRDVDLLLCDPERLVDVIAREPRVHHHDVARARRVDVLRAVHTARALVHPFRVMQGHEVVHHRRPDAAALGWIHPVAEVQDVETAEQHFRRRRAGPAPQGAHRMRSRKEGQPPLHSEAQQRRPNRSASTHARGREGEHLVHTGRRLDDAAQRPAHVVADACPLMRQGRDVDDDPHAGCT